MAVQYDVSAMELIRLFGCDKPASGALWEVKMPALLEEFLRLAKDQPLFERPQPSLTRDSYITVLATKAC